MEGELESIIIALQSGINFSLGLQMVRHFIAIAKFNRHRCRESTSFLSFHVNRVLGDQSNDQ